ncbi:MAG: AAA family ATPase [Lachnospiraceae bacterium]|nr:AAA family ATPase [Lachnospiraceae bacterium]
MIFYEYKILFRAKDVKTEGGVKQLSLDPSTDGFDKEYCNLISRANRDIRNLGRDGSTLAAQIYYAVPDELSVVMGCSDTGNGGGDCVDIVCRYLEKNYSLVVSDVTDMSEITARTYSEKIEKGNEDGFMARWRCSDIQADYFSNYDFCIREMIPEIKNMSREEAVSRAEELMGDKSLLEEIERIYSPENKKGFYGIPVHYKLSVTCRDAAEGIIGLMAGALASNGRLMGSRINYISDIKESCFNDRDVEKIFRYGEGTVLAIEMSGDDEEHGNYASSYQKVMDFYEKLILKHQLKTLCIFVDLSEKEGFGNAMVNRMAEFIDIIDIREGCGGRNEAVKYFMYRAAKDGHAASEKDIRSLFTERKQYTAGEVDDKYSEWVRRGLKDRIYRAYSKCSTVSVDRSVSVNEPYRDLQNMIGLDGIKKVVDGIIDTAAIKKMRSRMGLGNTDASLHMIFTGNPGSAKTTVARLVAQILKKEGILENGSFVECGRSELVGKYVGWTAKNVSRYFRMAKGGVLFIDEAYSLVDDSHSFGDEAINTIVQEMENHREDTIVIFAGYPDKMQEFLARNEGLRSRIAFHLDFPDYDSDELYRILELMAHDRGLKLGKGTEEKCREIFENACNVPEFGNGRYVRNLLERAQMSQSHRIVRDHKGGKVGKNIVKTLLPEDFTPGEINVRKPEKRQIGFRV